MYRRTYTKPDGRRLVLYGARREPAAGPTASPGPRPAADPHRRWQPLRGEWVVYAGHREERTFLPPPEWDPLAPTSRALKTVLLEYDGLWSRPFPYVVFDQAPADGEPHPEAHVHAEEKAAELRAVAVEIA